ncbi:MAG: hypothetical protein ABI300_10045 [Rhodanobacter sp.]
MNRASSLASTAGADVLERILDAPSGLVVLDCVDARASLVQFRDLARRSGQALYLWEPSRGMSSLRDMQGRFPDCQSLGSALRFMRQSMHFGVYFLLGVELPLAASEAKLLRQLACAPTGHVRRVVMLSAPATLVEHFGDIALRLHYDNAPARRVRMRDGRWLADG